MNHNSHIENILNNMISSILPDLLPVIIIITVIACSLRISYLIKHHQKLILYKDLYALIFILYILCLFQIVTFQDVSYGTSNYIPFKEIFRYNFGSRLFVKNIVGNILLFLPYGYFVSDFLIDFTTGKSRCPAPLRRFGLLSSGKNVNSL